MNRFRSFLDPPSPTHLFLSSFSLTSQIPPEWKKKPKLFLLCGLEVLQDGGGRGGAIMGVARQSRVGMEVNMGVRQEIIVVQFLLRKKNEQ